MRNYLSSRGSHNMLASVFVLFSHGCSVGAGGRDGGR